MVQIGVVGASSCSEDICSLAEEVGRQIARRGAVLICGGLGGVMEAACRGARAEGGMTIGILPGSDRREANSFVDIAVVTGMGQARNLIIVQSSDAVIAIAGGYGTLSEIALALRSNVPVIGVSTWDIAAPIIRAKDGPEAVARAFDSLRA
ncbi:MAG TPA: TIGR00725 family protein [Candidatus Latescibacteria bacterium]|nr:TIGR00725 family protein [Candidatus Latescibacterota bacterium]